MGGPNISMTKKISLVFLTISVYFFALITAMLIIPYLFITIAMIYLLVGIYNFVKNMYSNAGLLGMALITNSIFIALGQYLEFYFPLSSIATNVFGVIASIVTVLVFYYWREGQKHVKVRIKNEKRDESIQKVSILDRIKFLATLIKRQRQLVTDKRYSQMLALQFAYIEYQEEKTKKEENNSIDFVLGKEVILQRNEYDQSTDV